VAGQFEISRQSGYPSMMQPPLACTLTEAEMRMRRQMILDSIRPALLSVTPLPTGYAFRFEPASEVLAHLGHVVDLERQCCSFLTYKIIVEAGHQPICLEVTGPPEAKVVIADFLSL
jgi:hypothetical protein